MSRRRKSVQREILPDPRYKDLVLAKFVRALMIDGKKNTAEKLIYSSFDIIEKKEKDKTPLEVFKSAIDNVQPQIETRSRRVGGATYQVPMEVRGERAQALAIRWIIETSRNRSENSMTGRLSAELLDAAENRGAAVKKREDTHRMAEANKAFAHYRW